MGGFFGLGGGSSRGSLHDNRRRQEGTVMTTDAPATPRRRGTQTQTTTPATGARNGPAQSRPRGPEAETIGTAQPRIGATTGPEAPNMQRNNADASLAALAAAIRARRKGAGTSVLTGLPVGTGAPRARLQRRTLMGS